MPVEKEKPWHGLALGCPVVLDATSPLYAMRCFSYKLRAHKPLFRGLSVATRGELSNAFRLSQAYVYIVSKYPSSNFWPRNPIFALYFPRRVLYDTPRMPVVLRLVAVAVLILLMSVPL